MASAWREDRGGVTGQAQRIAAALRRAESASGWARAVQARRRGPGGPPGRGGTAEPTCDAAVAGLESTTTRAHGGFGGAPKFPPSMVLEFLLRHRERDAGDPGTLALAMATGTLDAMARGGMYDQLGGGFARYSVDAEWVVPHFEKMLYDNALLARVYAHWWRRTGSALARRVAADTCAFMMRELRTAEGGFASALDADSEGEEGKFYVWTPGQLREVLGPADARYAAEAFGVTGGGTFEHGKSVLQLRARPGGSRAPRAGPRARCWRRASGGSARAGTTRSSPPGTAWRSRRWPRRACCSSARTSSRRRATRRSCSPVRTWPTAGSTRISRDGISGSQRGRARGLRVCRRGLPGPVRRHRGGPLAGPRRAAARDRAGHGSATRRAASTTPRTTASR